MIPFKIILEGTSAGLLMHNARLADPFDPLTIKKAAVAAKRKKTEEDQLELSKLEWQGGLYYDPKLGPYMPGSNVFKALVEAARKSKDGKLVEQGLIINTDTNPLMYEGPRDAESMWDSGRFVFRVTVKQQTSRIVRTRPLFRDWACEVEGVLDDNVLNLRDLEGFAERAGLYIGVGDWRPKFGRFEAAVKTL